MAMENASLMDGLPIFASKKTLFMIVFFFVYIYIYTLLLFNVAN